MTIYTAIFSPYEDLKEPLVVTPGWQYICFTDQPFKSNVWDVRQMKAANPQRDARRLKILNPLHSEIWVDGSFTINCDLNIFWQQHFRAPFTVPSHPIRDCVFDECVACVRNKRGNSNDIRNQLIAYKQLRMPPHAGLISSGILLRDSSILVREWCHKWHDEVVLRSTRDQLAFAHTVWKYGAVHNTFKWDYRNAQDFIFKTHYHRRKEDADANRLA